MSASLVGSEMCIRDSPHPPQASEGSTPPHGSRPQSARQSGCCVRAVGARRNLGHPPAQAPGPPPWGLGRPRSRAPRPAWDGGAAGFGGGAASSSPIAKPHSSLDGSGSGEPWELPSPRVWAGVRPWLSRRSAA
eukprot:4877748-Alexandrium_andersonii.AAC.1